MVLPTNVESLGNTGRQGITWKSSCLNKNGLIGYGTVLSDQVGI